MGGEATRVEAHPDAASDSAAAADPPPSGSGSMGITVEARDVTYCVPVAASSTPYRLPWRRQQRPKALLRHVSFTAQPGRLLYIMGGSGAGKSTLLDLLSHRARADGGVGWQSGELCYNGMEQRRAWRHVEPHVAYVRQADIHLAELTVRETLAFAAAFRLKAPRQEREQRVKEVAALLGLTSVLESRVGGPLDRGISGGQLKRLSVGVEILRPPLLLFLDEPTSGLDSVMAEEVMAFVAALCRPTDTPTPATGSNTTVITTIHQPSEAVFNLSEDLVLLGKGGRVCYAGPTREAVPFVLGACQGLPSLPAPAEFSNPADFLLACVSGAVANTTTTAPSNNTTTAAGPSSPIKIGGAGSSSSTMMALYEASRRQAREAAGPSVPPLERGGGGKVEARGRLPPPPLHTIGLLGQVSTLWRRGALVLWRQPGILRTMFGREILSGILYGVIYYQQGSPTLVPASPDNRNSSPYAVAPASLNVISLLYFSVYNLLWANMETMSSFFFWRAIYEQERDGHVYRPLAFLLASPLVLLPWIALSYLCFLLLALLLTGVPEQFTLGTPMAAISLTLLAIYFLTMGLVARLGRPEWAYVLVPIIFVICGSLTGFMVIPSQTPVVYRALQNAIFLRYSYAAVVLAQFNHGGDDHNNGPRPDVSAVYKRLGFEGFNDQLGVGGCLAVVSGFLALFALNAYLALLPSRPRLRPLTREEAGRAHSLASMSFVGQAGLVDATAMATPLLLSSLEEGSGVVQSPEGIAGEEEEEDGDGNWKEGKKGRQQQEQPPPLSLEEFRRRSTLMPEGNGGALFFRDVGYRLSSSLSSNKAQQRGDKDEKSVPLLSGSKGKEDNGGIVILHGGVTGCVKAGEMMAVMGASGAGKSTLLDVLAGRKTTGVVSGQVCATREIKRTAYVTQDDVHLPTLTVRETLHYAALLRMEEEVSPSARLKRVDEIEAMLGLEEARDVLVGGDAFHQGLSGGQRRRLTLGVEVIALPDLLFLDEPTTGLDSSTALELMHAVRGLCDRQRAVVVTIHQPSMEIYALFDRLTLLAQGWLAYHGPAEGILSYLSTPPLLLEPSSPITTTTTTTAINPADFALRVASCAFLPIPVSKPSTNGSTSNGGASLLRRLASSSSLTPSSSNGNMRRLASSSSLNASAGSSSSSSQNLRRLASSSSLTAEEAAAAPITPEFLAEAFARSTVGVAVDAEVPSALELRAMQKEEKEHTKNKKKSKKATQEGKERRYPRTLLSQIYILNRRHFAKTIQDKRALFLNHTNYLVLSLFWSSLFSASGGNDPQTRLALLYSSTCIVSFANQNVIPALFQLRPLFYRERGAGIYGTIPHCLALDTPYLCMNALTSFAFGSVVYAMASLRPGIEHFFFYYCSLALMSFTSLSFIVFLSACLPSIRELNAIWSFMGYVITVCAGFMSRVSTMPAWADYATMGCWTRWGFQGLAINQFQHTPGGQSFLQELGFAPYQDWWSLAVLISMVFALRVGLVLATRYWTFEKR